MILKKYQSYISLIFIKKFLVVSLVFFCIAILINIFEEIKFTEKYDANGYYIVYLSILNAPSIVFEIFPFIFLITIKFFYLGLRDKNELEILNTNGISNTRLIVLLASITLIIGVFLLVFYYSFSSNLKSKYLDIKNRFSNLKSILLILSGAIIINFAIVYFFKSYI